MHKVPDLIIARKCKSFSFGLTSIEFPFLEMFNLLNSTESMSMYPIPVSVSIL